MYKLYHNNIIKALGGTKISNIVLPGLCIGDAMYYFGPFGFGVYCCDHVLTAQVLEKVEVWESIKREGKGHRHRLYKVKLSFLPESYYAVSVASRCT